MKLFGGDTEANRREKNLTAIYFLHFHAHEELNRKKDRQTNENIYITYISPESCFHIHTQKGQNYEMDVRKNVY